MLFYARFGGGEMDREKADLVISGIFGGLSCNKSCKAAGVPISTFFTWVSKDAALAEQYAHAREAMIESMADKILEIAESPADSAVEVQRRRLELDARKWLLSKVAPKKYGDSVRIEGSDDSPLKIEQTIDVSVLSTDVLSQIMSAKDAADKK